MTDMLSSPVIGIDVSEHNGAINWEAVKSSDKVGFVMIRAGFGKGVIDKQFKRNAFECNRLGIPIGIYWFSYAKTAAEAESEAEYCLNIIKDYKIDYPVAFDFENDSVANCKKAGVTIKDKSFATTLALNFLYKIANAGYVAANYTNPAYLNQYFDQSRLSMYDLWLAQWPTNPNPEKQPEISPDIWQYSSKGSIPGISTAVDMNACYRNYIKTTGTPVSSPPTVPSIMDQDWAKEAVEKAKKYGISDGSRPDALATRVEVMAMVIRAIELVRNVDDVDKVAGFVKAIDDAFKDYGLKGFPMNQIDDGK